MDESLSRQNPNNNEPSPEMIQEIESALSPVADELAAKEYINGVLDEVEQTAVPKTEITEDGVTSEVFSKAQEERAKEFLGSTAMGFIDSFESSFDRVLSDYEDDKKILLDPIKMLYNQTQEAAAELDRKMQGQRKVETPMFDTFVRMGVASKDETPQEGFSRLKVLNQISKGEMINEADQAMLDKFDNILHQASKEVGIRESGQHDKAPILDAMQEAEFIPPSATSEELLSQVSKLSEAVAKSDPRRQPAGHQ